MSDLYESVQHAGNIIPRLYLLVTVGSAYVKTGEAPVKLILRDLLDMVKGVQQPIRGLFLRYYLLKLMKDKLPDTGSPYEGEGGDVNDSIDFILQNLSEMNRLWVRMQHISAGKDKEQREVERNELRVTVGENIIRLGHLEGLTYEVYRTTVLPKILEIIVICKDPLAQ
jgi:vacuolar protein sorting-associated protein 35